MSTPKQLLVSSDLVGEAYVSDRKWPVLRHIPVEANKDIDSIFSTPYYLNVIQNQVHRIHFYLRDQDLQPIQFTSGEFTAVLHLKRIA